MPLNSGPDYENSEKFKSRFSDPMADHKRKARQRLIGSIFFSLIVFTVSILLFRDEPRSLVEDIVVENSFKSKTSKNTENPPRISNTKSKKTKTKKRRNSIF